MNFKEGEFDREEVARILNLVVVLTSRKRDIERDMEKIGLTKEEMSLYLILDNKVSVVPKSVEKSDKSEKSERTTSARKDQNG